jgi:hypothetical protein
MPASDEKSQETSLTDVAAGGPAIAMFGANQLAHFSSEETRMVAVPPWLQIASALATLILLVVLTILVLGTIPVMIAVRREFRRMSEELTKALAGAGPMLKDASNLLTELREIAGSVRSDTVAVHQFVTDVDSRAREIGHRAEERLAELDAAFGVLRDGLEDAVVSVAAVAHGVRAGTAALGLGTEDDDEPEAPEDGSEAPGGEEDDFLEVGAHNGNDRAGSPGRRAQPRIRGQRREK